MVDVKRGCWHVVHDGLPDQRPSLTLLSHVFCARANLGVLQCSTKPPGFYAKSEDTHENFDWAAGRCIKMK
jgi:hypothetical protein